MFQLMHFLQLLYDRSQLQEHLKWFPLYFYQALDVLKLHNHCMIYSFPKLKASLQLFIFWLNQGAYFLLLIAPYRLCTLEPKVLSYFQLTSFLLVYSLQLMHELLEYGLLIITRKLNRSSPNLQMLLNNMNLLNLQNNLCHLNSQNLLLLPLFFYIFICL
jgi:hypothetical protein